MLIPHGVITRRSRLICTLIVSVATIVPHTSSPSVAAVTLAPSATSNRRNIRRNSRPGTLTSIWLRTSASSPSTRITVADTSKNVARSPPLRHGGLDSPPWSGRCAVLWHTLPASVQEKTAEHEPSRSHNRPCADRGCTRETRHHDALDGAACSTNWRRRAASSDSKRFCTTRRPPRPNLSPRSPRDSTLGRAFFGDDK